VGNLPGGIQIPAGTDTLEFELRANNNFSTFIKDIVVSAGIPDLSSVLLSDRSYRPICRR
jgi:hypothetical protein